MLLPALAFFPPSFPTSKFILNLFHEASFLAKYSNTLKFKHNVAEGFQAAPRKRGQSRRGTDGYHHVDFAEGLWRGKAAHQPRLWYCTSEFKQINIKGTRPALKWNLSLEIVTI